MDLARQVQCVDCVSCEHEKTFVLTSLDWMNRVGSPFDVPTVRFEAAAWSRRRPSKHFKLRSLTDVFGC